VDSLDSVQDLSAAVVHVQAQTARLV
jgi:hypothetical protein